MCRLVPIANNPTALDVILELAKHIDLLSDKERLVKTLKQVHSLNNEERALHEKALLETEHWQKTKEDAQKQTAFWQAEQTIANEKLCAAELAESSLANTIKDIKAREDSIAKTRELQAQQAVVFERRDAEQNEARKQLDKERKEFERLKGGR